MRADDQRGSLRKLPGKPDGFRCMFDGGGELSLPLQHGSHHLPCTHAEAHGFSSHGVLEEVLGDLLALLEAALFQEAFGLHVGHVPPGAGVLAFQRYLSRSGCVAGRLWIVPEVPGLAGIQAGEHILGVTHGHRMAPGLQRLGCEFEPACQFLDYLSGGFPSAGFEQRDVAR